MAPHCHVSSNRWESELCRPPAESVTSLRSLPPTSWATRASGADEKGTFEALKAHRKELIDPLIAAYKGQIVKTCQLHGSAFMRRKMHLRDGPPDVQRRGIRGVTVRTSAELASTNLASAMVRAAGHQA